MDSLAVSVLALLGAAVALWGIAALRQNLGNLRAPVETRLCEVVSKRREDLAGAGWEASTLYHVAYRASDGSEFELQVPETEYNRLAVGTRGSLLQQGAWFRGFHAESTP